MAHHPPRMVRIASTRAICRAGNISWKNIPNKIQIRVVVVITHSRPFTINYMEWDIARSPLTSLMAMITRFRMSSLNWICTSQINLILA
jgi:hypothetical protein